MEKRSTHIRIPLNPLHSLFLRLPLPSRKLRLQRLLTLLLNLPRILAPLIMLTRLRTNINTLIILPHRKIRLRLPQIRPYKLRIPLNRLIAVLHRTRETKQLDKARSAVGVAARVVGRPLDHFGVGFYGGGPVCGFEFRVSEFAGFFGFFGGDVGLFFGFNFGLFGGAELGEDVGGAVFG